MSDLPAAPTQQSGTAAAVLVENATAFRPSIVCLANQSGGAGKSTTGTALACTAARGGLRVLLIDLDAQRDASHVLGYSNPDDLCGLCGEEVETDRGQEIGACPQSTDGRHDLQITMFDVLCGDGIGMEEAIVEALVPDDEGNLVAIPGLHLALASTKLSGADLALAQAVGGDHRLANAIASVADRYDLVLIDCPASLGKLMVSILVACTHVIACVKAGLKEIRALTELERTIHTVNLHLRRGVEPLVLGAVVTCDVPSQHHGRAYDDAAGIVADTYGDRALPTVSRSVRVPEAYAYRRPITEHDPAGKVTRDYREVYQGLQGLGIIAKAGSTGTS